MSKEQINLSDALDQINDIKTDLGTALNNKGMTVTNEFASYPTAVTNASTRTLQFPCNQIETYDYMLGSSLISTARILLDSMNSGEVPFGKICQFENSIISQVNRDSQRNISAVALSTPDIDYSQQLGTYNENAATIQLAGQNDNFNFKIVPVEAGWVQFKITDALTNKNYYINARVRDFSWDFIDVYDNFDYIYTSDASMQQVDHNSLEVGTKYLIQGYVKSTITGYGNCVNSVKFTTTTPYFPDYCVTDETFMHTIANFDHIEVFSTNGNFTITKEYFEPTEKEEYFITPTTAGEDQICVKFLDENNNSIVDYCIIIASANEPTNHLIICDANDTFKFNNSSTVTTEGPDANNYYYIDDLSSVEPITSLKEFSSGTTSTYIKINFDTSNVTVVDDLLYSANSLVTLDLSGCDFSSCSDFKWMLYNNHIANIDLRDVILPNGADYSKMFQNATMLYNIYINSMDVLNKITNNLSSAGSGYPSTNASIEYLDGDNVTATYTWDGAAWTTGE